EEKKRRARAPPPRLAPFPRARGGEAGEPRHALHFLHGDLGLGHRYSSSRCAYSRDRRLRPTLAKCTVAITSLPSRSMPTRTASPQRACPSLAPTTKGRSCASVTGTRPAAAPRPAGGSDREAFSSTSCSTGISRRKREGSPSP